VRLNEAFERLEHQDDARPPAARSPLAAVSLIFSLIAIGLASYVLYLVQVPIADDGASERQLFEDQFGARLQAIEADRTRLNELHQQLSEVSAGLVTESKDPSEAIMSRVEGVLDANLKEIKQLIGTTSEDWLLAEVEYLIRLGNQRVLMEGDVRTAIALFKSADEILRDSQGLTAFDLRQAIASDISLLQAVAELDSEGIYLQLSALVAQVERLPQKSLDYQMPDLAPLASSPSANIWERALGLVRQAGNRLRGLIDYRSNAARITPILPPEEEYYLRQNLVLRLHLAQLGLLRGNQQVYSTSIQEARDWIGRYFDTDQSVTSASLATLEALSAIDISRDLPSVTAALRQVRKLLADFHENRSD
jgi:uroporphyrin-3 C-methyltransferase